MKSEYPGGGSIYQGEKSPPARRAWGSLLLPILLILFLVAAHFLNLFMQWTAIRKELAQKPAFHSPEYSFLGFSLFSSGKIAAAQRLPNAAPTGRIYAYFDPLHPAVFMVWNNGRTGDFFDLGPVMTALPAGTSRVALFPAAVFLLSHKGNALARNYGGSLLGRAWAGYIDKQAAARGKVNGPLHGSFVAKQLEGSRYLKIPYLVYFFLPLATILLLAATYGAAMLTAFFYYAGMFFLFDHQILFVSLPFGWVFKALGVELPAPGVLTVIAGLIAAFFLGFSFWGLSRWKKHEIQPSAKWAVFFFVLLPLFLFF